jgi:hypothetical protein
VPRRPEREASGTTGLAASSARRLRLGSRLVRSEADFDRYIAEHNIPEEGWPEAFAR